VSETFDRLVDEFARLPGVGRKTARRLTLHVLKTDASEARALADALVELKEKTRPCRICNNITESELCSVCADPKRDKNRILVVEEVSDLMAVEATHEYRGSYHVLMGSISPIDGTGPEDTKIEGLVERVKSGGIDEVIIATNPNLKGEATALYISSLLKPYKTKVTRIAYGLPMGGALEYTDPGTLAKSLEGRREVG